MRTLSEWVEGSVKLKANKAIELEDGDFLRIESIHEDRETTEVFIRGWRFRRCTDMNGMLKRDKNEICLVIDLIEGDTITDTQRFRTGEGLQCCQQGLEKVPLSEFKRVRRVILTNERPPAHSYREGGDRRLPRDDILSGAVLVCRTKYVVIYRRDKFRQPGHWCEKAVVRLRACEVDPPTSVSDKQLREAWRGPTAEGGSRVGFLDGELDFDRAERQWFLSPHAPKGQPGQGSLAEAASSSRSGSRASSPIDLDPGSPTEQRRARRAGLQKVKVLYRVSSDTHAKLSLETVLSDGEDDDVEEIPSLNLTPTRRSGTSSDWPTKRRNATARAVSPELYEMRVVNRSEIGTLETDISSTFTLTQSISKRIAAPATPPSTPGNSTPQRRKRTLHEDEEVIELSAGYPTPNTQSSTRRRLFTATAFQNPDLFTPDSTKSTRHGNMAFRPSSNQRGKVGMLRYATSGSSALSKEHPATPSSCSSRSKTTSPLSIQQKRIRRYTFGDAFCGAGGTSRGAKMAGLRVEWGFDSAVNPISSFQSNFFGAHAYHSSADCFTQLQDDDHKVDILHISPPCQPFSPAHTVAGKDDETNEASFLGTAAVIKKTRPRIVTFEQTSGLAERRDEWLTAMIHVIAELGFSVRWKVVNLAEYGLPQARKRLILIASWCVSSRSKQAIPM
jgi:C-5 cytosine-specific DNA methylase